MEDYSMNNEIPTPSRAVENRGFSYPVGPMPSHMPTCPYQPPAPIENQVGGTSDTMHVPITETAHDINMRRM